ncbi:MAG: thioredoxin domain-containing protein [Bacteroidota bacterium]|nr:thioredoxin domain-containing protein [Bacteroidota bacterium]
MKTHTNRLIHALSPYLLQHAYNPVDWHEWGDEAWKKAKEENKLVLVSIGYSACHWCHVMEHESFESEEVADIMNKSIISIKVDREERPDVDQVYMDACQLITGRGGWPLNVICLPDGRPIHAGTYFPKAHWMDTIKKLSDFYIQDPAKADEYATKLTEGMANIETVSIKNENAELTNNTDDIYHNLQKAFDITLGGLGYVPKFPMPPVWNFVLDYHSKTCNEIAKVQLFQTLSKMAMGGIYDQLAGGFARYSVDGEWKVPHFEKMLYDNAQLLSLYSRTYPLYKEPLFKETAKGIIDFAMTELYSNDGLFYSALDADSEGIEGKYYVWSEEEITLLLGDNSKHFITFFAVGGAGFWEHDYNILLQTKPIEIYCQDNQLELEEFKNYILACKKLLLAERSKRIKPGLDDKIIVSWNCLMAKGLIHAHKYFGNEEYIITAEKCINKIIEIALDIELNLNRIIKNGQSKISGFLEDYSYIIDVLLELYQVTGKEYYVELAKNLTEKTEADFYDKEAGLFCFISKKGEQLIVKKFDTTDDVMPCANAVMATNLLKLGHYYANTNWINRAKEMLNKVNPQFVKFPTGYAHWLQLQLVVETELVQWVYIGRPTELQLQNYILPGVIFAFANNDSKLPLVSGKVGNDPAKKHYICKGNTCLPPVHSIEEALSLCFS